MSSAIENISLKRLDTPCSLFINNESVKKFFKAHSIVTARDLKNLDLRKVVVLASVDLDGTLDAIESLSEDYLKRINKIIRNTISAIIEHRAITMMLDRNGFF